MDSTEGTFEFKLYRYTPSLGAAILFLVLFALITLYHLYQVIRLRSWYFLVFVIGGVFQIIGYICRTLAHNDTNSIPIYSVQTIMILLAPPLYAASIYMTLGRLIRYLDAEALSIVPIRWLTLIFVIGDVVAFVMQAAGGGIMASGTLSAMNTGETVTIIGLAVQLAFFSVFIVTSTIFHWRIHQNPTEKSLIKGQTKRTETTWVTVMGVLYVSSVLILVRSIFRLIEYAQGNAGYLISHEAFMYVFDSMLMFLTMVVMSFYHPSKLLNPRNMQRRGGESDGTTTQLHRLSSA
ncbi:RTA1 like protein [Aspergillus flavus AF70]|nr:RTA1 like protein [Aspergillus flavus AF70]RAQ41873.1 RTA1 like protein [Aspergillus flavus]